MQCSGIPPHVVLLSELKAIKDAVGKLPAAVEKNLLSLSEQFGNVTIDGVEGVFRKLFAELNLPRLCEGDCREQEPEEALKSADAASASYFNWSSGHMSKLPENFVFETQLFPWQYIKLLLSPARYASSGGKLVCALRLVSAKHDVDSRRSDCASQRRHCSNYHTIHKWIKTFEDVYPFMVAAAKEGNNGKLQQLTDTVVPLLYEGMRTKFKNSNKLKLHRFTKLIQMHNKKKKSNS